MANISARLGILMGANLVFSNILVNLARAKDSSAYSLSFTCGSIDLKKKKNANENMNNQKEERAAIR